MLLYDSLKTWFVCSFVIREHRTVSIHLRGWLETSTTNVLEESLSLLLNYLIFLLFAQIYSEVFAPSHRIIQ